MNIMAKIGASIAFSGLLIGNALAAAPFYVSNPSYPVQCNGQQSYQVELINDTTDRYSINSDTNLMHQKYEDYNLGSVNSSNSNLVYTVVYPDSYIYFTITRISDEKVATTSASLCGYIWMSQLKF